MLGDIFGLIAGLIRAVAALSRLRELRPPFASSLGVFATIFGEPIGPTAGLVCADAAGVNVLRHVGSTFTGRGVD